MPTIPPDVDWSATAAWIALAISIVGTVAGPLITVALTNHHQLKLRELELAHQAQAEYEQHCYTAINNFISSAGRCLFFADKDSRKELGESLPPIYPYVPEELWPTLDQFFSFASNHDLDKAQKLYPQIIRSLSGILKEQYQASHKAK